MTRAGNFRAWAAVLALASVVASISVGMVALTVRGTVPLPAQLAALAVVTACVVGLVRIGRAGGLS